MQFFHGYNAWATSTIAETFNPTASRTFSLDACDIVGDLTAVFEQYRIIRVEVWLQPSFTTVAEAAPENALWCTAVDLDDAATPTSLAQLMNRQGAQVSPLTNSHYHSWCPHVASPVYQGAFTAYSDPVIQPWIDCGYPAVQHFGLKGACSGTSSTTAISIRARFTVEFRGVGV